MGLSDDCSMCKPRHDPYLRRCELCNSFKELCKTYRGTASYFRAAKGMRFTLSHYHSISLLALMGHSTLGFLRLLLHVVPRLSSDSHHPLCLTSQAHCIIRSASCEPSAHGC